MKIKYVILLLTYFLTSCAVSGEKLNFRAGNDTAQLEKIHVVAAEIGEDVVGNTRVIITVNDIGLDIINKFLSKNINRNMDILFGKKIISNSVPIRTDHFSKDIIISFKDKILAKEFYNEYGAPQL